MKRIILASASRQRKKLLKLLGLPFTVQASKVKELKKIQTTCSALVKHNALLKAEDIASRHKKGIIIGSDTVVYIGQKKLILKPRTLKEAKKNLKTLISRPQWVYTGVAVIDAQTGEKMADYEKTKVFMSPLTDKEIDRYHQKVLPFDKAGGFDIEGHGSMFIRRIEGCYTNVIGLPMAKLGMMLKKFGVSIFSFFLMVSLVGCTNEFNLATEKEEMILYSTDREVIIGAKVALKIEEQYEVVEDTEIQDKVEVMLDRLVEVSDRKDIVYFIKVLDKDLLNAVSLPGGYIFLFRGIVDHAENDDQIAGVIAHELGHITAKHGVKRLQSAYAAMALQVASAVAGGGRAARGTSLALNSLFMEYSQIAEFEADRLSVKYMKKAGYDPLEMAKFLEIMKYEADKKGPRRFSYWRTHPHIPERIGYVSKEIKGKLEFRDYIRMMEGRNF